ncbi:MAG: hypothetical protein C4526_03240 [Nitrospiraceae bacterium]|nr:MAG: hypothetical protein C4526_03240 [Nitrospiraceae bacterium]
MEMKRLLMIVVALLLFMIIGAGNSWSTIGLPTANFSGNAKTTATTDTAGSLSLDNAVISQVNYLNGTHITENGANESIIGKSVIISGATRQSGSTFTDAVLTITDTSSTDGPFNYFSATLSDIVFVTDGLKWYLNPTLDINNPGTLNLTNVVLNTDVAHPSQYINELQSVIGTNATLGMKMILLLVTGSLNGDSTSDIFTGLIDGTPPTVDAPSGARSMGFWKTHDEERTSFINTAVTKSGGVFTSANDLNYYLSMQGKKTMLQKAIQQYAALCLNVASSLSESTLLTSGEIQILQYLNPGYNTGSTVGNAMTEIKNAILANANLENAKDLGDEINNRDEKNSGN